MDLKGREVMYRWLLVGGFLVLCALWLVHEFPPVRYHVTEAAQDGKYTGPMVVVDRFNLWTGRHDRILMDDDGATMLTHRIEQR